MKDNCFTEFCGFLLYINKNQPQVHPCTLPPGPPSHLPPQATLQPFTEPCLSSVSHTTNSQWPSILHTWHCTFLCSSLHTAPLLPPLLPPCPQVCSLCSFLHCCPENKFISVITLDSIYMCQYMIFIFLFLTFSLCNRL